MTVWIEEIPGGMQKVHSHIPQEIYDAVLKCSMFVNPIPFLLARPRVFVFMGREFRIGCSYCHRTKQKPGRKSCDGCGAPR